ncbi:MAG: preprotein translocase subunit SecB [Francisellaceae bacterium]|jgi:preprotein translocase subunit SecB
MSDKEQQAQPNFFIQKVYSKDMSFEVPNAPEMFKLNWQPQTNVEIHTNFSKLEENIYEIDLSLTVTAKNQNQTAFIAEIKQTGIFTITGIADEQMGHMLGSYCPNILFPYAKESISAMVTKGGLPLINLAPVNFDALYAQNLAKQQEEATKH